MKKIICAVLALGCNAVYFYLAVSRQFYAVFTGDDPKAVVFPLITALVVTALTIIISRIGELEFPFVFPGIICLLSGYDAILYGDLEETNIANTAVLHIAIAVGVCLFTALILSISYFII